MLVILVCLKSNQTTPISTGKYTLEANGKKWNFSTALKICQTQNLTLAMPKTLQELEELSLFLESEGMSGVEVWLGAKRDYKTDIHYWLDGPGALESGTVIDEDDVRWDEYPAPGENCVSMHNYDVRAWNDETFKFIGRCCIRSLCAIVCQTKGRSKYISTVFNIR